MGASRFFTEPGKRSVKLEAGNVQSYKESAS